VRPSNPTSIASDAAPPASFHWAPWLIGAAFAATALARALSHVSAQHFALFWDDALFFKRVAYNIIHHGFAGWNQVDGPVFVNTSQLFQALASVVLVLFPDHYNAAIVFWGALALTLSLWVLARATKTDAVGAFLLLCLLQAPPLFLSMTTGMETPLVILVLAAFLLELLRGDAARPRLALGVGLQLAVYLTRPDAILMSFAAAVGLEVVLGRWKNALHVALWTGAGILVVTLALYAYYGTPLPLSTFLKVSPVSIYDQAYLSMGLTNKLVNLSQLGVLALPLVPIILIGWDRTNLVLFASAALFVGFHALTTYEIAAYHARFYAPCLPFLFAAALRGLPRVNTPLRQLLLLGWGVLSGAVFAHAYERNWIETERGYGPDVVSFEEYARYLVAVPAVALFLLLPAFFSAATRRVRRPENEPEAEGAAQREPVPGRTERWLRVLVPTAASLCLGAVQTSRTLPAEIGVVSDEVSNMRTIRSHTADVNIDVIRRCFEEPLTLTHSEIGLPGVLFMESKIIDFTGLANPKVVNGTFDFETTCESERPEFIYRPHYTHKALNETLDQSPCLSAGYTRVKLPRRSSCPLHVRNDLLAHYLACQR
jgi:hypothetical protein